jgi:hypothetical protein
MIDGLSLADLWINGTPCASNVHKTNIHNALITYVKINVHKILSMTLKK